MQPWNPLLWASVHWVELSIGSALLSLLYKIYKILEKLKSYGDGIEASRESLEVIKNNHLTHIQTELEKVNTTLGGLREDNRGMRDDLRAVLTRMP